MKVRNITGTAKKKCACRTWLEHWRKHHHTGNGIDFFCSHKDCYNIDLIGAHVVKATGSDKNHYIIPLCKKHNNSAEVFKIVSYATLVSANKMNTCSRSKPKS